ncbi:MAG TPA: response regulator transcription factor [Cyclobacteriaceae bacterium]|nr:response regulator transcription factor [Cyclobacteriaceae bacterium]
MNYFSKRRVLLIEDDKILLDCFTYIINNSDKFIVVGSYTCGEEALVEMPRTRPDIVVTDIKLSSLSGIEVTRRIKEKYPQTEIIILSVYEDNDMVFNALKAGASGYITKSSNYLELMAALEEIVRGGAPMSSRIARMVIHNFHLNPESPLTQREKEVLHLIAEGKTYTQISEQLFISRDTARTHIRNIYSKLNVNRKSEAIDRATRDKLI